MTCRYCPDPVAAKGMCNLHYRRYLRTGNPLRPQRQARYTSQEFEGLGIIKCVACGKPTRDHPLTEPCPMAAVR